MEPNVLRLPEQLDGPVLVALVGPAGAGKTTLARHWTCSGWPETAVLELDSYRATVSDDPGDQESTPAAVMLMHRALEARLARRRISVVDQTATRLDVRLDLVDRAHRHDIPAIAVVLTTPLAVCVARNMGREGTSRFVREEEVRRQHAAIIDALPGLAGEFDQVHTYAGEEQ